MLESQDENARPMVNQRQSNLMLMTQSRKAEIVEREKSVGMIKPETDPFWSARLASKTDKLMHNSVTEGFRKKAISRLQDSTTAFAASTRVKAYDEKIEDNRGDIPKVREESNVSLSALKSQGQPPYY